MSEFITMQMIDEAIASIHQKTNQKPKIGLILGSGLGDLAESVKLADVIPYSQIPHWPQSTIQGHKGRLVIGNMEGKLILVMQGRAHFYEGYSMPIIGFPMRVMAKLGITTLIVTNAAGAINPAYQPGEVMILNDHISLITMGGQNPLRGPNLDELGERFPDMSQPYDRELIKLAHKIASQNNIPVREGVYVCLAGPSFETPADLKFLRTIGADAVGMSTVPETIVARHARLKVLGFSGISNKANLDGTTITTHEEVLLAGKEIAPKLDTIIRGVLREI